MSIRASLISQIIHYDHQKKPMFVINMISEKVNDEISFVRNIFLGDFGHGIMIKRV